jgi:hypothetical protein
MSQAARQITASDILPMDEYVAIRKDHRKKMMAIKKIVVWPWALSPPFFSRVTRR